MKAFSIISVALWIVIIGVMLCATFWPNCPTYSATLGPRLLFLAIAIACVHSLLK